MKNSGKKKSKIIIYIVLYFVWGVAMTALGESIFPETANGDVDTPTWYIMLTVYAPLFIPAVKLLRKLIGSGLGIADFIIGKLPKSKDEFRIPLSKNGRNELAQELYYDISYYAEKANKTRSVSEFFSCYDLMLESLRKAEKLDGKATCIQGSFTLDRIKLESEFQKHIHDALERSSDEILSEYKTAYKYDNAYMRKRIQEFKSDCDTYLEKMDSANKGYANALFLYLCNECKVTDLLDADDLSETHCDISDFGDYELLKIDGMEGHDFEYWTADLLRASGFTDVEVTRGSGDQGVDVLAKKDGIKYAIQCKCYSSNLGNTPVQEVNAGKVFYHCQVAAVITNQYFTQGAKELAEATGVLLWDRDWIRKMIEK